MSSQIGSLRYLLPHLYWGISGTIADPLLEDAMGEMFTLTEVVLEELCNLSHFLGLQVLVVPLVVSGGKMQTYTLISQLDGI